MGHVLVQGSEYNPHQLLSLWSPHVLDGVALAYRGDPSRHGERDIPLLVAGVDEKQKCHMVKWEHLCCLRDHGGAGDLRVPQDKCCPAPVTD